MGGRAERYFIPAAVGFAPVLLALLTWAPGGLSPAQTVILHTALPVLAAELLVVVVALRDGLAGWLRSNPLPRLALAALALWLAVAIATSVLIAPAQGAAIRWTVHWIVHLLFGFSVAYLCSRTLRVRDLVACYLAGFLLYTVVYLAFVAVNWSRPVDWVHDLPGAIHIRHVAIYAGAMTGMSIGAMAGARGRAAWTLASVTATVGFALGLWTGSRGMVLSVAGATLVGAIAIPAMRSMRVLGAAAASLIIAIAAVAWLPVPNSEMMGVARQVAATTEHEVTTGRLQMWANVVHAIARNPILGYGPGQMPIVAPFGTMAQPHNLILQLLLDWGVVGFISVLVLAFFYLRRAIPEVRREADPLAAPAMAMLSLVLLSMIDAAMFHVLPVSIFAASAGMIAAGWRTRERRRSAAAGSAA